MYLDNQNRGKKKGTEEKRDYESAKIGHWLEEGEVKRGRRNTLTKSRK